jgi:PBP1b-binding outer membrane lipoprotein LpoB
MKMKSLTLLTAILLSVSGCSKNEPGPNNDIQRGPASTEQVQPIDKGGNIYLAPADNPAERCKDLYGNESC